MFEWFKNCSVSCCYGEDDLRQKHFPIKPIVPVSAACTAFIVGFGENAAGASQGVQAAAALGSWGACCALGCCMATVAYRTVKQRSRPAPEPALFYGDFDRVDYQAVSPQEELR